MPQCRATYLPTYLSTVPWEEEFFLVWATSAVTGYEGGGGRGGVGCNWLPGMSWLLWIVWILRICNSPGLRTPKYLHATYIHTHNDWHLGIPINYIYLAHIYVCMYRGERVSYIQYFCSVLLCSSASACLISAALAITGAPQSLPPICCC